MRRLLLLVPVLAGCAQVGGSGTLNGNSAEAIIVIGATPQQCWTANVGGASQEGCGNAEFPVTDAMGLFSSNVQKADDSKQPVYISIKQDGEIVETNTTSAAYGVAQVVYDGR